MAKEFKNLNEISISLEKGLELSGKQITFEVSTRALRDANKLTPIDVRERKKGKKGKKGDDETSKGGTLRNSGLLASDTSNKGVLTWDTHYAKKMWTHKGKFSNSTSRNKWAERSFEANLNTYQKMITKIINKNKLK